MLTSSRGFNNVLQAQSIKPGWCDRSTHRPPEGLGLGSNGIRGEPSAGADQRASGVAAAAYVLRRRQLGGLRDNGVVRRIGPGDLEVVAFWVAEMGRASGDELRVDGFLGHASAGGAHLLGEPVNLLGAVDLHADGEADASGARLGFGVPVAGELGEGEQG